MKKCRHIIREVEAGSIAEELELAPGDELCLSTDRRLRMSLTTTIW